MSDAHTLSYALLGAQWHIEVFAADEFTTVETWIGAQLDSLSLPGGIHQGPAPLATAFPYGGFEYVTALDDDVTYGDQATARLRYKVFVVQQGESYDALASYAAQLRTALTTKNHDVTGGTIVRSVRQFPWKVREDYPHE